MADAPRRSFAEDFPMLGIGAVEALEVPRACDDFRQVFTFTRPGGHRLPSDVGSGETAHAVEFLCGEVVIVNGTVRGEAPQRAEG